jgi:hypothetical protein
MSIMRFEIRAIADPEALPRLVGYVSQLGLVPDCFNAIKVDDFMTVVIEQYGMGDDQAAIIANKMRSSFLIESVRLTKNEQPISPHLIEPDDISCRRVAD